MAKRGKRIRRKRVRSSPTFLSGLRSNRITLLIGAILICIVLAVLLIVYVPAAYRSWRETRLLKQANEMLRKENFAEASRAAHEALRIKGDSLPAFTILAETTERENQQETVAWRAQIARLQPHDLASQLNLVSAALRFGQLDIARKALERIPPNDRDKAAYHVVAGWLARAQGNEEDVEKHFAAAVEKEPKNDLYQFNLAVIQIRSKDDKKSAAARSTLERLTKVAEFRAGSLRALLSDAVQNNDLKAADGFAQELQMSQELTFGDYLLCLDFYQKLDAKKLDLILEKVKPVAARNPDDLARLMGWMNHHARSAEVLKWEEKLKSEQTTHPPPAIAIAEAFAAVKNWSRLKRWTHNGDWGEAEYLRFAYQAYAARQSHGSAADAESDSLWDSAERAAANNPEHLADLARLATKWRLTTEAEQLWLQVSKNPPNRREALDALIEIYRQENDLQNLYRIMQRLHESSPNEAGATADYARLGLLIEHNAAESHRLAKEAYDKAPDDVDCAVTYAFSLYGQGRTAEGIEILKRFTPERLHDPHAAVFTAVLLLDENQSDAAKEYIDAARKGPIFPEEKRLLEEARAKEAAAPSPSSIASPTPAASPTPSASPTPHS
jgi:thioredoxin-like negative regulator of GroEL